MRNALRTGFIIAALAAVVPSVFQQRLEACGHCCCRTCRQPRGRCCCRTGFVAQTACLQQRDIVATEYRTEPIVETVPATVVENVMVDEGSYQTVWVPRLTTKAVARTTYQSRTAYRTVPYQVTRRVSEYSTQPALGAIPYGTTSSYANSVASPAYSGAPLLGGTYPTIAGLPIYPTPIAATPGSVNLVPDARYADMPATPISPRSASSASRFSDSRSADRGSSLFVPAPSAAQVWQTPRSSLVR